MEDFFGRGPQNDVPLLIGSNSDEGSNFPAPRTLSAFQDDARKTLGPFADEFLGMYKANNDTEARKASEAAVRDTRITHHTRRNSRAPPRRDHPQSDAPTPRPAMPTTRRRQTSTGPYSS
jgi:carboxylesterase type B